MAQPIKNWVVWLALASLVAGYVAAVAAISYLLLFNTLANAGSWISDKERIEYYANGSGPFMRETQALARCRLDLGAWGGTQQIRLKRAICCTDLEFDFRMEPNSYFCLILSRQHDVFKGLRFSLAPLFESAYLTWRDTGEFLAKEPINSGPLDAGRWHHLAMDFQDTARPALTIDGQAIAIPAIPLPVVNFGFRSGARSVLINHIAFNHRNDGEKFFPAAKWSKTFWVALALVLAVNAAIWWGLLAAEAGERAARTCLLATNVSAAVIVTVVALFLFYFHLQRYPTGDALSNAEKDFFERNMETRQCEIRADLEEIVGKSPAIILFLGGSQAYGCSARRWDERYSDIIQHRLDESPATRGKFKCVNAGIAGNPLYGTVEYYEKNWAPFKPKIVVANFNDGPERFEQDLLRLVEFNQQQGIATLLVLQPGSIETLPGENPSHEIVRAVAAKMGVPCAETFNDMKNKIDQGFLWWDEQHPTSFGHQVMADSIFPALQPLLTPFIR